VLADLADIQRIEREAAGLQPLVVTGDAVGVDERLGGNHRLGMCSHRRRLHRNRSDRARGRRYLRRCLRGRIGNGRGEQCRAGEEEVNPVDPHAISNSYTAQSKCGSIASPGTLRRRDDRLTRINTRDFACAVIGGPRQPGAPRHAVLSD
jgi:hypothetical protein